MSCSQRRAAVIALAELQAILLAGDAGQWRAWWDKHQAEREDVARLLDVALARPKRFRTAAQVLSAAEKRSFRALPRAVQEAVEEELRTEGEKETEGRE